MKNLREVHVTKWISQQSVLGNVQSPCCSVGCCSSHVEKHSGTGQGEGHQHCRKLRGDDGTRLWVMLGDHIPESQKIQTNCQETVKARTVIH